MYRHILLKLAGSFQPRDVTQARFPLLLLYCESCISNDYSFIVIPASPTLFPPFYSLLMAISLLQNSFFYLTSLRTFWTT